MDGDRSDNIGNLVAEVELAVQVNTSTFGSELSLKNLIILDTILQNLQDRID